MIACTKGRIEGLAYPEKFFGKVDWSDLVMTHVHLRRAVLKECRIVRSVFSYGDLSYADLSSCTLTENRFLHMRLTGVDFRGADLSGAEFYLTDLAQAKFDSTTRLPFSMKTALDLGMVHVSRD